MDDFTFLNIKRKRKNTLSFLAGFLIFFAFSSFDSFSTFASTLDTDKNGSAITKDDSMVDNIDKSLSKISSGFYFADSGECQVSNKLEIRPFDFGFKDGVTDGSLNADNVDLSAKWNL
ncbi:MAG: hypothetical protein ACKVJF_08650, partial [Flavobacteriales bacterium]